MSDQPGKTLVTQIPQVSGTVELVKAGPAQLRGVPDVVEVGGCQKHGLLLSCEDREYLPDSMGDALYV